MIVTEDDLSGDHIEALVTPGSGVLAVAVKQFLADEPCQRIAARLRGTDGWKTYVDPSAQGIGTFGGRALFDCVGRDECDDYFASADVARNGVRQLLAPYVNPADLIRAKVDEAWAPGCGLMKFGGRRANAGLVRSFSNGGEAKPHTDRCDWDWPCPETAEVNHQLAVNAYLSQAEAGGELELWDFRPTRPQYNELRDRDSYGLRRDLLPPPAAVIRPTPGSLIIFNASRVHAVRASRGDGARVTVSGFLAYRGPDQRLGFFS